MAEIKELPESIKDWERVSAHSHITGLGLKGLKAKKKADGLVGQEKAREAAGIVVELVKSGKFAGRAVLIAGPPGTGKTAVALGMAKELGRDVPFVPITASEIYSAEIKKTEFLTQALRKAIGVRIKEMRKIYEGVVEKLDIEKEAHPYNPYQQIPVSATVKLCTTEECKSLSMDQAFALQFLQQGVSEGDVIQIDADGNKVVKLGKSSKYAKDKKLDLSAEELLPVPSGTVLKNKEFVYTLTLHQMDVLNARAARSDFFSVLFGGSSKEVDSELRSEINSTVKSWVESGKAEIIPGVLFIDECSMLDIESFAFLNRAMEGELAPIIIFATNRGMSEIRGTSIKAPHGMPLDLIDRLLIINTSDYSASEIKEILKIRSKVEGIELSPEALDYLTSIGDKTSLRHAVHLLAPASIVAGNSAVKKEHVEEVEKLFADVNTSINYLKKYEKRMLE